MPKVEFLTDGLLVLVSFYGAFGDLRRGLIPNWLTYTGLLAGLLIRLVCYGFGGILGLGLVSSVFGAGFCGILFGLCAVLGRGMAAGDVKLVSALGALAGFIFSLHLVMWIAVSGAILALCLLLLRKRLLSTSSRLKVFVSKDEKKIIIPYGLPIALGVCLALLGKYGLY